jgi:tetraacyldisaccharide 4'-kinase
MRGLKDKFRYLFFPVALFYWGLSFWRNLFYVTGFFVSHRLPVPVVSVGNITLGGTGKTPTVVTVAHMLQKLGKHPAVISRGYMRETTGTVVVSKGEKVLVPWNEAGDEAILISQRLPSVPVIVDEVRYRGAILAVEHFDCDVIVLDDAFQHRAIERDLDIVLINSCEPPEHYKMIPYGRLREPIWSLKRADLVIWSRADQSQPAPVIRKWVYQRSMKSLKSRLSAGNIENLKDLKLFAYCGIGDPQSFLFLLNQLNLKVIEFQPFPDHYVYKEAEILRLKTKAKSLGAAHLVTTEKDWVKLTEDEREEGFIRFVPVDTVFLNSGETVLEETLKKLF